VPASRSRTARRRRGQRPSGAGLLAPRMVVRAGRSARTAPRMARGLRWRRVRTHRDARRPVAPMDVRQRRRHRRTVRDHLGAMASRHAVPPGTLWSARPVTRMTSQRTGRSSLRTTTSAITAHRPSASTETETETETATASATATAVAREERRPEVPSRREERAAGQPGEMKHGALLAREPRHLAQLRPPGASWNCPDTTVHYG
jgi:hypothetical protein